MSISSVSSVSNEGNNGANAHRNVSSATSSSFHHKDESIPIHIHNPHSAVPSYSSVSHVEPLQSVNSEATQELPTPPPAVPQQRRQLQLLPRSLPLPPHIITPMEPAVSSVSAADTTLVSSPVNASSSDRAASSSLSATNKPQQPFRPSQPNDGSSSKTGGGGGGRGGGQQQRSGHNHQQHNHQQHYNNNNNNNNKQNNHNSKEKKVAPPPTTFEPPRLVIEVAKIEAKNPFAALDDDDE